MKLFRIRLTFVIERGEPDPEPLEGEPAIGIVIDPHRWSDPQADEWEWPDEEDSA